MKISHILLATTMELRRIYHDKRRMFILVLGPIIISIIFGYVFYYRPQDVDLTVFVDQFQNTTPSEYSVTGQVIDAIHGSERFAVTRVYTLEDAYKRLSEGKTRAVVVLQEGETDLRSINVTIDVTDRIIQQIIRIELPQILEAFSKQYAIGFLSYSGVSYQQAMEIMHPVDIDVKTNEWRDIKYFDLGASGVIALFVMGICLLMSVTSITSERAMGTIERIYASPYKASEIVLSKILAYIALAIVVAIVIVATLKILFSIVLADLFLVLLTSILIGTNAVVLGILVSAVVNTDLEAIEGGIICWLQGILLMGFTWPVETMHPVIQWMSKLLPFSYGLHALRHINLSNWGLDQIWLDLVILIGFTLAQTLLAIRFLRRSIG